MHPQTVSYTSSLCFACWAFVGAARDWRSHLSPPLRHTKKTKKTPDHPHLKSVFCSLGMGWSNGKRSGLKDSGSSHTYRGSSTAAAAAAGSRSSSSNTFQGRNHPSPPPPPTQKSLSLFKMPGVGWGWRWVGGRMEMGRWGGDG